MTFSFRRFGLAVWIVRAKLVLGVAFAMLGLSAVLATMLAVLAARGEATMSVAYAALVSVALLIALLPVARGVVVFRTGRLRSARTKGWIEVNDVTAVVLDQSSGTLAVGVEVDGSRRAVWSHGAAGFGEQASNRLASRLAAKLGVEIVRQ